MRGTEFFSVQSDMEIDTGRYEDLNLGADDFNNIEGYNEIDKYMDGSVGSFESVSTEGSFDSLYSNEHLTDPLDLNADYLGANFNPQGEHFEQDNPYTVLIETDMLQDPLDEMDDKILQSIFDDDILTFQHSTY